jgi:hypothetical protein
MKEDIKRIPEGSPISILMYAKGTCHMIVMMNGKHEVLIGDHTFRVWSSNGTVDYDLNQIQKVLHDGTQFIVEVESP